MLCEKLGLPHQFFYNADGVVETNINYNGPNHEWLGFERSDTAGNSASSFETTITKLADDGSVNAAWTALC